MNNITISLRTATDRKTPCHWLVVGDVRMLVSYETIMAFTGPLGDGFQRVRRSHNYSVTTGKHLRETGCADYPRAVSDEDFEAKLQAALREGIHPMLAAVDTLHGQEV